MEKQTYTVRMQCYNCGETQDLELEKGNEAIHRMEPPCKVCGYRLIPKPYIVRYSV